jgi:hypothetical protein
MFSEVNESRLNAMCDGLGKEEETTVSSKESLTREIILRYIYVHCLYISSLYIQMQRIDCDAYNCLDIPTTIKPSKCQLEDKRSLHSDNSQNSLENSCLMQKNS